jgi:two-component system response regulator QseB
MSSARVLLVEDDPRLGPVTRDVLAISWEVTLVTTVTAAKEALKGTLVDVVVLDRRLPDGDGADLASWARAQAIPTPILMLTALGQLDERVRGLDAGANDYLLKPFEFDELEARLRALTRDYSPRGSGVPIGSWTLYPNDHSIDSPYSGRITLSAQETALLAALGQHPDTVFSREQLLDAVGSTDGRVGTIDTYVHHLRRKTDRDLIETVRGRGYRSGTLA